MLNFEYFNPTRIVLGRDTIAELDRLIPGDAKVLLVLRVCGFAFVTPEWKASTMPPCPARRMAGSSGYTSTTTAGDSTCRRLLHLLPRTGWAN